MRGMMRYVTPVDVPVQSIYQMAQPYGASSTPWADTALAGSTVEVLLPRYLTLDDRPPHDNLSVSATKSNVSQSVWYGSIEGHHIVLDYVEGVRQMGMDNPKSHMVALAQAAGRGIEMAWYPDFETYPNEFYTVRVKRKAPRRLNKMMLWSFAFDLTIMGSQQFPDTVPAFI